MPIDASIISGLRPVQIQQPDPLEQYGKSLTLKHLMLQNQQGEQAAQDDNAVRSAYQQAGGDSKRLRALLEGGGQYKAIQSLDKFNLDTEAKRAQIDKDKAETVAKAVAAHRDQLAGVETPQAAAQWVAAAYQDPILSPIVSRTGSVQDALARIPQDPAAFATWRQQSALGATKFIEMNKPHVTTQDLGGTSQLVATPGLGGAPSVLSSTPRTMSPDAVASNALGKAHLAVTAATADPFGTLGIRDIAARAGAPTPAASATPAGAAASNASLSGDQYLATLPKPMADQVKALAEGRMQFPGGFALKSPYWQQMIQSVSQYDPSFDAVNYNARNKTFASFSGGPDAEKVKNINQTLHHAGQLSEAIDKLDNFTGLATPLNYAVNPVEKFFGDSRQGVFEQKAQAVASELRKVYAGAGGGGLTELKKWEESLPVNASKDAQKAYLQSGMELLNGALSAMQEKYQTGMGPRANVGNLLKPEARAILQKLAPGTLAESKDQPSAATPAKPQTFNDLPDPAKFSGKFMTDTNTNTRYKSVGGKWVKQ